MTFSRHPRQIRGNYERGNVRALIRSELDTNGTYRVRISLYCHLRGIYYEEEDNLAVYVKRSQRADVILLIVLSFPSAKAALS